jgi:hypothetical protein
MTRLWLSDKAALAMKAGDPKVKAEQETKAKERAEREAQARVDRDEKRRLQEQRRERLKTERAEAGCADGRLSTALDDYREVERAVNPKKRDEAGHEVVLADAEVRGARKSLELAQMKLAAAEKSLVEARACHERMVDLSNEKLPAAKGKLQVAWADNDTTWKRMAPAYRKKHRDRVLKNTVKGVLGIKSGGED